MERILAAEPYIIAEVGSNWRSLQDCLDSIAMAKACGADAVKFQHFSHWDLYGPLSDSLITSAAATEERRDNMVDRWLVALSNKCKDVGIDFMCSAFSIEGYRRVDPFVMCHKIASSEFNHVPLVREVMRLGKPVIASCGGSDRGTIVKMVTSELAKVEPQVVLMYCNAAYPSFQHDLAEIGRLRDWVSGYRIPVGFSDHSLDISASAMAVDHYGAVVVEKHFRLDHISGTPDAGHSLDQTAFKAMVDRIRKGPTESFGSAEEDGFRLTALRRAKAIAPIKRGERLKYRVNFDYFRSSSKEEAMLGGMSAFFHDQMIAGNGWLINRDIAPGEPITFNDRVKE